MAMYYVADDGLDETSDEDLKRMVANGFFKPYTRTLKNSKDVCGVCHRRIRWRQCPPCLHCRSVSHEHCLVDEAPYRLLCTDCIADD